MQYWQETAERLIRALSPADFAERPLYIVPRAEVDECFEHRSGTCWAWTSPWLDLPLRDQLERQSRWHGRGFATIVYEGAIRAYHGALAPLERIDRALIDTVLHELAHYVECGPLAILQEPLERLSPVLRFLADPPPAPPEADPDNPQQSAPPWSQHRPQFLRSVLHIQQRAEAAGYRTRAQAILLGNQYGLAGIERYADALGDEPARRRAEPLLAVMASDPPQEFQCLAAADLARAQAAWEQSHAESPHWEIEP